MRNAHLALKNVSIDYGAYRAVEDVSFDVEAGEFFVILGPSGCGKSTLLLAIASLVEKASGAIELDGSELKGPDTDRIVVFQEFEQLLPWKTVADNIRFGLEARKDKSLSDDVVLERLLNMVNLHRAAGKYPLQLSGGMKQRAALARAIAVDPPVLLMDEPFASLDAETRETLQEEVKRIWSETGKTVVFITHSIDEALYLGTRILIMSAHPGRVSAILNVPAVDDDAGIRHMRIRLRELMRNGVSSGEIDQRRRAS